MAEAIPTSAGHLSITLRIGVTLVEPGENPDEIISRADHAMDRAKQRGRHLVLPFSDQIASPGADRSITWQVPAPRGAASRSALSCNGPRQSTATHPWPPRKQEGWTPCFPPSPYHRTA